MFIKSLTGIFLLLLVFSAASCAHNVSSAFQTGKEQQGQQQYAAAISSYTQAISEQKGKALVAASYFYRGECYERTGEFSKAYQDFYTATQMSCNIINTNKASNTNTTALGVLAQSTLCNNYGPQAIKRVEPKLPAAQVESIRKKVDSSLLLK